MSYQSFKQQYAQMLSKQVGAGEVVRAEDLQVKVLAPHQLEALGEVLEALRVMASVRSRVGMLIMLHRLPLKPLGLHELGLMLHAIETAQAEARHAATRLGAGAVVYPGEGVAA